MKRKRILPILFFFILLAGLFARPLAAQETNGGIEAPPPADSITLGTMFRQGGWAMYPLLIFSVAGVGLTIYCGFLIRERNFAQGDAVKALSDAINADDVERARSVCAEDDGYLTAIIASGLEVIGEGHRAAPVVNEAMEETATKVLAGPLVFVQYLQVIASVSPMMGLLGTVSGMVKAFSNIAAQGLGRPELLANNISEALVTTATGLLIAIPALMAYFYFKNKFGKVSAGIYESAGKVSRLMMSKGWIESSVSSAGPRA